MTETVTVWAGPSNVEIERLVLSCLLGPDSRAAFARASDLTPKEFVEEPHKAIFDAAAVLHGRGHALGVEVVRDRIAESQGDEAAAGAMEAVESALDRLVVGPLHPEYESLVDALIERSQRRRLAEIMRKAISDTLDGEESAGEIAAKVSGELSRKIRGASTEAKMASDVLDDFPGGMDEFLNPSLGFGTGVSNLDAIYLGFRPGELTIVGARPSLGKSALAVSIANKLTMEGRMVDFYSLEMSDIEITRRLLSMKSSVDYVSLVRERVEGASRQRVLDAREQMRSCKLYINECASGMDIADMERAVLKRSSEGVDLVIIDYLQLMTSKARMRDGRTQEVGDISRRLKQLAKEAKVPILAMAQLNRALESRSGKGGRKPMLADLRESGSIEQDADCVILLHRERISEINEDQAYYSQNAELIVAKQRNGPTGMARAYLNAGTMHFTGVEDAYE